ncbi:MAG: class I SAM-dependent methyltransferase [Acidimicrobiales bacterium]
MNEDIEGFLDTLGRGDSSTVEISAALHSDGGWRSFQSLSYPDFDLCASSPDRTFDVVICEQVLEHVVDPWRAADTLHQLCRPGGHLIVSTPFLVKVHREPEDYWRFTPDGLRLLLGRAGFEVLQIRAWGNRPCVRRNFAHWAPQQRWRTLRNEADFPIVVWAFARRAP